MGLLSPILRNVQGDCIAWWCPGCDTCHTIATGEGDGPRWGWNGDINKPTFTPSVVTWWDEPLNWNDAEALRRDIDEARARKEAGATGDAAKIPVIAKRCHSFVRDGQMQFLSDCTHALAGQTVPIPPWPYPETA